MTGLPRQSASDLLSCHHPTAHTMCGDSHTHTEVEGGDAELGLGSNLCSPSALLPPGPWLMPAWRPSLSLQAHSLVGERVVVQPMFVEGPAEAPGHLAAEHSVPPGPREDSSCFTDLSSLVHS